jgi:hypothetical protein
MPPEHQAGSSNLSGRTIPSFLTLRNAAIARLNLHLLPFPELLCNRKRYDSWHAIGSLAG